MDSTPYTLLAFAAVIAAGILGTFLAKLTRELFTRLTKGSTYDRNDNNPNQHL